MADDTVYCLCRQPYDETQFMIECEVCKDWFHGGCVGVQEHQAADIEIYHCPNCQQKSGPLVLKKRRNYHRHDYSELDDCTSKAVQTGTVVFIQELKTRNFPSADDVPIQRLHGHQLTKDYLYENGFEYPILVDKKDGLELKVPPSNFSIQDVENCVGSMREIDVIDVARQDDYKMLMREWTEYYNSPNRHKIFNVISLEFSKTKLADYVCAPKIVREMSWVQNLWPDSFPDNVDFTKPAVQLYCLMGVKDSFTDFHIDFGGTSVWYHILRGEKVFYLIKPTPTNLMLYERWLSSSSQSESFFGDQVETCYKCVVKQGQTLFIPTGWIHAVLTPIDSLVFGGNFLHSLCVDLQIQCYEIERKVKTPEKYLFPNFEMVNWYAAKHILDLIKDDGTDKKIPDYIIMAAKSLGTALKNWTHKKDYIKRDNIPDSVQYGKLLKELNKESKRFADIKKPKEEKEKKKKKKKGHEKDADEKLELKKKKGHEKDADEKLELKKKKGHEKDTDEKLELKKKKGHEKDADKKPEPKKKKEKGHEKDADKKPELLHSLSQEDLKKLEQGISSKLSAEQEAVKKESKKGKGSKKDTKKDAKKDKGVKKEGKKEKNVKKETDIKIESEEDMSEDSAEKRAEALKVRIPKAGAFMSDISVYDFDEPDEEESTKPQLGSPTKTDIRLSIETSPKPGASPRLTMSPRQGMSPRLKLSPGLSTSEPKLSGALSPGKKLAQSDARATPATSIKLKVSNGKIVSGSSPSKLGVSPSKLGVSPSKLGVSPPKLSGSPSKLGGSPSKLGGSPSKLGGTGNFKVLGGANKPEKDAEKGADADEEEEDQLVVDENPQKRKKRSLTPAEKAQLGSLKLKLSLKLQEEAAAAVAAAAAGDDDDEGELDELGNRINMPTIQGGLNGSIADILEASGYGTETDFKIDDDLGKRAASPSMRDAIQGMLSMSRMGGFYPMASAGNQPGERSRIGVQRPKRYVYEDDNGEKMPHCFKDEEYVYPTLDLSDNEDGHVFKPRGRLKKDETWNPKAKIGPAVVKEERPQREGVRRESVESGLAAASARLASQPKPKRQYIRKKPKPAASLSHSYSANMYSPQPGTSSGSSLSNSAPASMLQNQLKRPGDTSPDFKAKRPKKGLATAKQRLGKILKIHKLMH